MGSGSRGNPEAVTHCARPRLNFPVTITGNPPTIGTHTVLSRTEMARITKSRNRDAFKLKGRETEIKNMHSLKDKLLTARLNGFIIMIPFYVYMFVNVGKRIKHYLCFVIIFYLFHTNCENTFERYFIFLDHAK